MYGKQKWNTQDILAILQNDMKGYKFLVEGPCGDIDSEWINVYSKDRSTKVIVFGFTTDHDIANPADCEVEIMSVVLCTTNGVGPNPSMELPSVKEITLIHEVTNVLKAEGYEIRHTGWEGHF
jgi:hypothetical protein